MGWTLCRDFLIESKWLDEDIVVFHQGSGETHRLNKYASKLLQLLMKQSAPMNEELLLECMKQTLPIDYDLKNTEVTQMLRELQRLQIVELVQ